MKKTMKTKMKSLLFQILSSRRNQTAEGIKKGCAYQQGRSSYVLTRMDYLGTGREKEVRKKKGREGTGVGKGNNNNKNNKTA